MVDTNSLYTEEQKKQIEDFNTRLGDIESLLIEMFQEIIQLRREGKDCLIAEFTYRNIRSKIPYVRNSLDEKELISLKAMISSLKKEIDDIKEQQIVNVKKEIEKMLDDEGIAYIGKMKEE